MVITIVGLSLILIIAGSVVGMYNRIVNGKNRVRRAWADVIARQMQKMKVIPELERGIKQYQEFEKSTMTQITELRSSLAKLSSDAIDTAALEKVQTLSQALVTGLRATFEQYPVLKTSDLYGKWMKELAEIQENITAALAIFNESVQSFNDSIQEFPNSIVNGMLNKEVAVQPFTDTAAHQEFEYQPNL